ncbi:hypothetical protein Taro_017226 [Colocasia esculenta]|uniref:Uncharacterized protein n=1 Tax=Colocasia esculenta TaxID=4460 RepID=A0A843UYR3_COLES|nr:hypothetical protein [Colocasia esculenta]
MVAPQEPVATGFGMRRTWPSRNGRDGGGCRDCFSDRFDCCGGFRNMVTTTGGVVTCLLSRQVDPSRLRAHRWHLVHVGGVLVVLGVRGGGHSDMKAPTGRLYSWSVAAARCIAIASEAGETSQQRQGARRPFRVPGSMGGDCENRLLGLGRGHRQARELMEKQGESDMLAPGQVQEDVLAEESVAQPQGAAAAAPAGEQQQQWYHPPPHQYADWFPMAEQFFRTLYQGAWQLG